MEIRFYHLTRQSLEEALPRLMEKVHGLGHRILIHGAEDALAETVDTALWTYREESFLAHGRVGAGFEAEQPILITTDHENANDAGVLVLLEGANSPLVEQIPLTVMMFDGKNSESVAACRQHWSHYKDQGATLTYWQQDERGGWSAKS